MVLPVTLLHSTDYRTSYIVHRTLCTLLLSVEFGGGNYIKNNENTDMGEKTTHELYCTELIEGSIMSPLLGKSV